MLAPHCVNHAVAIRLEKSVGTLRFAACARRFLPSDAAGRPKTAEFAPADQMVKAMSLFIG
jgi:hypothetical protein